MQSPVMLHSNWPSAQGFGAIEEKPNKFIGNMQGF